MVLLLCDSGGTNGCVMTVIASTMMLTKSASLSLISSSLVSLSCWVSKKSANPVAAVEVAMDGKVIPFCCSLPTEERRNSLDNNED